MPSKAGAGELELLIAKVFERIGSQTSEPGESEYRFDLAVWIDEIEPLIPNPILVEIKWRIGSGSEQLSLESKFQRQLSKVHALLGLIVYLESDSSRDMTSTLSWPLVIYLQADELINLAETGRLARKIMDERNARAHLRRPGN